MKLLLIILNFVVLSIVHANTIEGDYAATCEAQMSVRRELNDVTKAMLGILSTPYGEYNRAKKLDDDLIAWTRKQVDALSPTKRAAMLEILNSVTWFHVRTFSGAVFAPYKRKLALFGVSKKQAGLFLNSDFRQSEYFRLRLIHELRRAIDLVAAEDTPEALEERIQSRRQRRMGVYRLEVPGLREQYRWLRTHYAPEDAKHFSRPIRWKDLLS